MKAGSLKLPPSWPGSMPTVLPASGSAAAACAGEAAGLVAPAREALPDWLEAADGSALADTAAVLGDAACRPTVPAVVHPAHTRATVPRAAAKRRVWCIVRA